MAGYWGTGKCGQFGNPNDPNDQVNRHSFGHDIPSLRLRNYQGPFDRDVLGRACEELQYYIERMKDTAVWYRIQRKTEVNIYGTIGSSDGFGESSNTFSHAELPENRENQDTNEAREAIFPGPQLNLPGNSRKTSKQTPTATVTSPVVDLVESDTGDGADNGYGSDCLIISEEKKPDGEERKYSLESDGIEIVQNEANSDIFVIEDDSSNDSQLEILNNTKDVDNALQDVYSGLNSKTGQTQNENTSTFMCDFCDFLSDERPLTQEHLNNAFHFAASEYTFDNTGNMKLKFPLALMNYKAKFKTVLVVCPDSSCLKVFPDIHVCAEHYNSRHLANENKRGCYGLIRVVQEEVCVNTVSPMKCCICYEKFDSRSFLNNHFLDYNHYPLSSVRDCQKIFFCTYCKTSFNGFENITSHQAQAHLKSADNGALNFTVFNYKNVECHTLPESQSAGTNTTAGASKRKHDGKTTDMEPKVKIPSNSEYLVRTEDDDLNSTSEEQFNVNIPCQSLDSSSHDNSILPGTSCVPPEESQVHHDENKLTEMFKCDYCMKSTKDKNQMYLHLVQDVHSSASTFLADDQGNIVYLKETKTVTFQGANFKKIAAICQENECRLLFDTIFMCVDHIVRCHHSKGGYYYVSDIVDRTPIKVPVSDNVCTVCKQHFSKNKQLNDHFSKLNHFPFKGRDDCYVYTLCCYCNKTFLSYKVATGHVKKHQAMAKNGKLDMVILYVSKFPRKYSIAPFELTKQGEIMSIRSRIANLQQMKKICGKKGRSELSKEIRNMKHLL